MSLEENKEIVRNLGEAFNNKDLVAIGEFIALDFVDHDLNIEGGKITNNSLIDFS
jgi:hypothetical protein